MAAALKKQQRADYERRAWELRRRGRTETSIAEEIGVDQSTVHRMLVRVETRLHKEFVKRAEELKARQTEQLDFVAEEALAAWERSRETAEKETIVSGRVRTTGEGEGIALPDQVTMTREGQAGDASFLAQARGAWADQRAIWGAEAPKKVAETDSAGRDLPPARFVTLRMVGTVETNDEQPA